jgi:hypothetical protein
MKGQARAGVLLSLIALAFVSAGGMAQASYQGTPGKVAYIGLDPNNAPLKLWDPASDSEVTLEAQTYSLPTQAEAVVGFVSAPAWSPDGTKLAYSKLIPDKGTIPKLKHTAIFVYDLTTGETKQVSHPPEGYADPNPLDTKDEGHTAGDWSPTWREDGNAIAFVRQVAAGKDDSRYGERGQNLWWVPAVGGEATQLTHFHGDGDKTEITSAVWIPKHAEIMVGEVAGSEVSLSRVAASGGTPTVVVAKAELVSDYDTSPDGENVSYTTIGRSGEQVFVQPIRGGGAGVEAPAEGPVGHYSNSGNGPLTKGCNDRSPQQCGLVEHLSASAEPERDIHPEETTRLALPIGGQWISSGAGGVPGRMAFDVQPQTLPILFLPGFFGSKITCGSSTLWPALPPGFVKMALGPDGVTNAGCGGAAPDGSIVKSVFGQDIYATTAQQLEQLNSTPGRVHLVGWDWRKSPQQSEGLVQKAVKEALESEGPWKEQGAERVVMIGHSYGGLMIRDFIEKHPEEVARVLTLGTPYWGAPKAIFPNAFGIETPDASSIEQAFEKALGLIDFARNLAGLYQLYPDEHYGPWLAVEGETLGVDQLDPFLAEIGANPSLYDQAQGFHTSIYDGFYDEQERIDVRAVVGTGMPTFGTVNIAGLLEEEPRVIVKFTDGDTTVPSKSGAQGPVGTLTPLGDPIHIQYTCRVNHVDLAKDPEVFESYKEFIDFGRAPEKLSSGACPDEGGVLQFNPGQIAKPPSEPSPPSESVVRAAWRHYGLSSTQARSAGVRQARARPAVASGPVTLEQAGQEGLADVANLPNQTLAVTTAGVPVTLSVTLNSGTFEWTPIHGESTGQALKFGPVSGTVLITPPQPGGAAPIVLHEGESLTGEPVSGSGEEEVGKAGGGGPIGPQSGGASGSVQLPPSASTQQGVVAVSALARLSGRLTQKLGRLVTVTVACPREACAASAKGLLSVRGSVKGTVKRLPLLSSRRVRLARGAHATLRLQIPAGAQRLAARALRHGGSVSATLTVTVLNGAHDTLRPTRTVKLIR